MSTTEQLVFDLPRHRAVGLDDFMAAPSNEAALQKVLGWQKWPHGKLLLVGPRGCGKTHLAGVWAAQADATMMALPQIVAATPDNLPPAIVIDDADAAAGDRDAERALFHLFNLTREASVPVLFVAEKASAKWGIGLADLASRMALLDVAKLSEPDDMLLSAVMVKQFMDRQLIVKPEVITFLVRRVGRSFSDLSQSVEQLDRAALRAGKSITIPFVKDVLREG